MHSHIIYRLPCTYENALYFFNHFHTFIYKMHIFSISSPMAYTHNYILYNCDIMLTHQAYALTYLFPLNSSHSFYQFQAHQTWTFLVQFKPTHSPNVVLSINLSVFNSPKNRTVGCPWAAHSPNVNSSWWNRMPYPFPVSYSPKYNLLYKL